MTSTRTTGAPERSGCAGDRQRGPPRRLGGHRSRFLGSTSRCSSSSASARRGSTPSRAAPRTSGPMWRDAQHRRSRCPLPVSWCEVHHPRSYSPTRPRTVYWIVSSSIEEAFEKRRAKLHWSVPNGPVTIWTRGRTSRCARAIGRRLGAAQRSPDRVARVAGPPRHGGVAEASVGVLTLVRSGDRARGGRGWLTWSGGPICGGSISLVCGDQGAGPADRVVAEHGAGGVALAGAAGLSARAAGVEARSV